MLLPWYCAECSTAGYSIAQPALPADIATRGTLLTEACLLPHAHRRGPRILRQLLSAHESCGRTEAAASNELLLVMVQGPTGESAPQTSGAACSVLLCHLVRRILTPVPRDSEPKPYTLETALTRGHPRTICSRLTAGGNRSTCGSGHRRSCWCCRSTGSTPVHRRHESTGVR